MEALTKGIGIIKERKEQGARNFFPKIFSSLTFLSFRSIIIYGVGMKLNEKSKALVGRKRKAPAPARLAMPLTLSKNSDDILGQVYAALGGVQGSVIYWRNHEEDFRNQVETKFFTKQVMKEAAQVQGQEVAKNIFQVFIQNNGLAKKDELADGHSILPNAVDEAEVLEDE